MNEYDVIVIGGGPAGMSAAIGAERQGAKTLIIERDEKIGGILNQCIHTGFGMKLYNEELTGTEFAARLVDKIYEPNSIEILVDTTCLGVTDCGSYKSVTVVSPLGGYRQIQGKTVILSTGCREKSAGSICLAGSRPVGIFTAGMAQKLCNLDGYLVGKNVVILGSGDIGLIMARRMTYEGAKVLAVIEIMPYSSGLKRNIVQCLDDYNIPLYLSHTITAVEGKNRVSAIRFAQVDEHMMPILTTEKRIPCDTLLLSVGLAPENEIIYGTDIEISTVTGGATVNQWNMTTSDGIFAAGNCLHVNDLVDNVVSEATHTGISAAKFANSDISNLKKFYKITAGNGIRYIVPQRISLQDNNESKKKTNSQDTPMLATNKDEKVTFFMRATAPGIKSKLTATVTNVISETNTTSTPVIAEKRLFGISPGEMIEFEIDLGKIIGDVTISLREEGV